jgi:KipI family sensor histidine kinase inhibitor
VSAPVIERLGEAVLLLRLGDRIDIGVNRRVHALAARLQAQRPPWLCEIVPAYASLSLHLERDVLERDSSKIDSLDHGADPLDVAESWLRSMFDDPVEDVASASPHIVEIPVYYGGAHGPDLVALAQHAGLSVAQTVERHCAVEYTVAMLGFAPGFPYLLGLDPELQMPRLATPRVKVPAGSVAIGGAQTGIYPRESPGGWRIIGHTVLTLFDAARGSPSLLQPGDRVRFFTSDLIATDVAPA